MKKLLLYLKHKLGFHTRECIVPCYNADREDKHTCRITMKDFTKDKIK
jgi:hypothetical protein